MINFWLDHGLFVLWGWMDTWVRAGENADCCVGLQKAKLSVSKRFGRRTVEIVQNNREISFNNATRFQRLLEPEWVGHNNKQTISTQKVKKQVYFLSIMIEYNLSQSLASGG